MFNKELNGEDFGGKGRVDAEFYSVRWVRDDPSWIKKCAPSFVKTRSVLCNDTFFGFLTLRGSVMADTPFSRLPGKPSIMVDGIMPTTALVSAVLEAGYHVELVGGMHYSLGALRAKVAEIQNLKVLP